VIASGQAGWNGTPSPTRLTELKIARLLPWSLIAVRVLIGPLLYLVAASHGARIWLVCGVTVAFLSDVFDGILARRLRVVSERLRVADSWTDGFYYAWVAATVWVTRPDVVLGFRGAIAAVFLLQLFSWGIDLVRYRRIASFHAYSAKLWGITLFSATLAFFCARDPGPFVWVAVAAGVVSNLEGLAIKCVLPTWQHDVPSFRHALWLRRRSNRASP
jgi:phosphatidylglycerophosphate synthase